MTFDREKRKDLLLQWAKPQFPKAEQSTTRSRVEFDSRFSPRTLTKLHLRLQRSAPVKDMTPEY